MKNNQDYNGPDTNIRITESKEQVSHPTHYQGSCAESWDLSVLEWGPEYAVAAWVIQAQQYYDRHEHKNGIQDLEKAKQFICHAKDFRDWYEMTYIGRKLMTQNFWDKVSFLERMVNDKYFKLKGENVGTMPF